MKALMSFWLGGVGEAHAEEALEAADPRWIEASVNIIGTEQRKKRTTLVDGGDV